MLKIHFINVGHGDCCVVEFLDSGRVSVIDINRSDSMDNDSAKEIYESSITGLRDSSEWRWNYDSGIIKTASLLERAGYDIQLTDPIDYLKSINNGSIFRFISTHPHMDHLSGLSTLNEKIGLTNFWVVGNNYTQEQDKLSDSQTLDWNLYKKFRDANETNVNGVTVIDPMEGSSADFYREDGIEILAPNSFLKKAGEENPNEMSYVLLIRHRGCKILLSGDAEESTWEYLVENHSEELENISVLKAAHHGRDSGYYKPAVELMSPLVTVVSVGKKPDTDASSKYRKHCDNVWSTRWKGNITFTINDEGKITYSTQYER